MIRTYEKNTSKSLNDRFRTFVRFRNFVVNQGFTLAEVLVVTALAGILIMLGVGIFIANNKFYANQQGRVTANHALREAADILAEYGRTSDALVASHTVGTDTYNLSAETVIFRMPALDASNEVISGAYDYGIITKDLVNANELKAIIDPDPASSRPARTRLVTSGLDSISLTYDNSDPGLVRKVDYTITLTEGNRNPVTKTIDGSVTLRN